MANRRISRGKKHMTRQTLAMSSSCWGAAEQLCSTTDVMYHYHPDAMVGCSSYSAGGGCTVRLHINHTRCIAVSSWVAFSREEHATEQGVSKSDLHAPLWVVSTPPSNATPGNHCGSTRQKHGLQNREERQWVAYGKKRHPELR